MISGQISARGIKHGTGNYALAVGGSIEHLELGSVVDEDAAQAMVIPELLDLAGCHGEQVIGREFGHQASHQDLPVWRNVHPHELAIIVGYDSTQAMAHASIFDL